MKVNLFPERHCIIALILLAVPAVLQAQFIYTTNDNSITITGYTGPGGVVVIPDATNGYPVTGIGDSAFEGCEVLTNIVIPGSVTSIGQSAFLECYYLTSVIIPNSVTNIGQLAFGACESLTNIVIPNSVISIGGWAFEGTKVATLTIPSSVISIGEGSPFAECPNLTNISVDAANPAYSSLDGVLFNKAQETIIAYPDGLTNSAYAIPNSVGSIGEEAFIDCSNLSSVAVPDSVTNIGGVAFSDCIRLNNFLIPTNVISIGGQAFWGCGITSMIIPGSVTSIGGQAFYACPRLAAVYVEGDAPPDVGNAFLDVPVIYYLPGTTGWGASFGGAPTVEETSPPEFEYTNYNGSITITGYNGPGGSVIIPGAFFGFGVTGIGNYAFENGANLTTVTIPGTVTNIGEGAFYGCTSLATIAIPGSVTDIGQDAFASCTGMTNVLIPNSLTSIADMEFQGCSSLTSITIPASVSSVGMFAFASCADLTSAYFQGNAPPDNGNVFSGDPEAVVYYLPGATGWGATFGGVPAIEEANQFEFEYTTNNGSLTVTGYLGPVGTVMIPSTINGFRVTSIGTNVFGGRHAAGITAVYIPNTVTNIAENAFANCTNLTYAYFLGNTPSNDGSAFYGDPDAVVYYSFSTTGWGPTFGGAPTVGVTPPNDFNWQVINGSITITYYGGLYRAVVVPPYINGMAVTSIGQNAFYNPYGNSVTNVVIPDTVISIGVDAFGDCTSLTTVIIPNSLTSIGKEAFYGCVSLTNIIIPDGVTNIGDQAFQDCISLTDIIIPGSVTSVGYDAFDYCTNLTSITISDGVAGLGIGAFGQCYSLTNVTIPGSVTIIGQGAFGYCTSLASVTISNGVTTIGPCAFESCPDLTSVAIPRSVSNIESGTLFYDDLTPFFDCLNLTNISVDAANPAYSSLGRVLFDKAQATLVEYPAGLTNRAYTIPAGVTSIGLSAFAGCANLISLTFPSSVTNIGSANTSYENSGLTSAYFLGNAPYNAGSAFLYTSCTVYYLPGTIGWGATFGGRPAMLWNPQATAFTAAGGQLRFNITGPTNATIVVEACTNLANPVWLPVSTITLSGSGTSSFSDPQLGNNPTRYYRFSAP